MSSKNIKMCQKNYFRDCPNTSLDEHTGEMVFLYAKSVLLHKISGLFVDSFRGSFIKISICLHVSGLRNVVLKFPFGLYEEAAPHAFSVK